MIARLLASRLRLHHLEGDIDERACCLRRPQVRSPHPPQRLIRASPIIVPDVPHNTSTRVPEGSTAIGGIGCHIMALSMNRDTVLFSHMGGEGANWVGIAPFTEKKARLPKLRRWHIRTFRHSGHPSGGSCRRQYHLQDPL